MNKQVKGIPTSYNVHPLNQHIVANGVNMVWASSKGTLWGHEIEPLYSNAPAAAFKNSQIHKILSLVDSIRIQHPNSYNISKSYLEKLIKNRDYNVLRQK
jgi:hypothetical protein